MVLAMLPTPPLFLAASLALVGCVGVGSGLPPDPMRHLVDVDSVGPTFRPSQPDEDAVRAQAALDLRCATGIVVRSVSNAVRAEGCGQVITYLAVSVWGDSYRVPGYAGEKVRVTLRRFVPVSREGADAAFAALERDAAALALEHRPVDRQRIAPWVELSQVAARELACPRDSVIVDIINYSRAPSTYLAEGCGSRGLFVKNSAGALVITSRVALTPGDSK